MLTLWDLLDPLLNTLTRRANPSSKVAPRQKPGGNAGAIRTNAQPIPQPPKAPTSAPTPKPRRRPTKPKEPAATDASMQAKYDAVVDKMLAQYQIRVRKWRGNMSGVAWYVMYRDGRRVNLIESPKPKGPMSAAIFLHEIGHHAIGFNVYKPRCLEEFHAWRWSLEAMEAHGLNITDAVRLRMHRSLHYAIGKASRRGIKSIPVELEPFLVKPPARRRRA